MTAFSFRTTPSVLSEIGATAKIGGFLAGRGCRKVAFVTDAMILELGLADAAMDGFRAAGLDVQEIQRPERVDVVLRAHDRIEGEEPVPDVRAALDRRRVEGELEAERGVRERERRGLEMDGDVVDESP